MWDILTSIIVMYSDGSRKGLLLVLINQTTNNGDSSQYTNHKNYRPNRRLLYNINRLISLVLGFSAKFYSLILTKKFIQKNTKSKPKHKNFYKAYSGMHKPVKVNKKLYYKT